MDVAYLSLGTFGNENKPRHGMKIRDKDWIVDSGSRKYPNWIDVISPSFRKCLTKLDKRGMNVAGMRLHTAIALQIVGQMLNDFYW